MKPVEGVHTVQDTSNSDSDVDASTRRAMINEVLGRVKPPPPQQGKVRTEINESSHTVPQTHPHSPSQLAREAMDRERHKHKDPQSEVQEQKLHSNPGGSTGKQYVVDVSKALETHREIEEELEEEKKQTRKAILENLDIDLDIIKGII